MAPSKARGRVSASLDYVQNEEKVDVGEIFYTSGDDRSFPKGMPVGKVQRRTPGKTFKEIYLVPSGFQQGLEEVLIVVEGVPKQTQPPPPCEAETRYVTRRSAPACSPKPPVTSARTVARPPRPERCRESPRPLLQSGIPATL